MRSYLRTRTDIIEWPDTKCLKCGEECILVKQNDSFYYSGTHCTNGQSGTHKMPSYYVSDCCEVEVKI